jgi:hypothetical protein
MIDFYDISSGRVDENDPPESMIYGFLCNLVWVAGYVFGSWYFAK